MSSSETYQTYCSQWSNDRNKGGFKKIALYHIYDEVNACFTTAGCTAVQLAPSDLSRWKNALALQLPNGQGQVAAVAPVAAGQPATYLITVQWAEVGEIAPVQFQVGIAT